eukprot:TRINITY_DN1457_c0_g1_i1.p2 TRINITY_DN1457_c0_g1~~TRINITY_DN1457_c0_g1_i1.p2  ORF type:complete len:137 (-),score=36.43 TRINITY_DN1457_c0_g1_i1:76-486(-)
MSFIITLLRVVVSLFLTAIFLFAGGNKLTDQLNPEMHKQLSEKFKEFIQLWQFPITADQFRLLVGGSEVVFAILLLIPGTIGKLSQFGLFVIMVGAVITHILQGDFKPFFPAFLGFLALLLLLLHPAKKTNAKKTN